jgi:hypothetical protein
MNQIPPPADGIWSMPYIYELVQQGIVKTKTLLPDDTVPISWNGVVVYVTRGIEIELPEFHYDLYVQSRKATNEAFANARASLERRAFGPGQTMVESGWNGNAPT